MLSRNSEPIFWRVRCFLSYDDLGLEKNGTEIKSQNKKKKRTLSVKSISFIEEIVPLRQSPFCLIRNCTICRDKFQETYSVKRSKV